MEEIRQRANDEALLDDLIELEMQEWEELHGEPQEGAGECEEF